MKDNSRRGFFKGVAGLFAAGAAGTLISGMAQAEERRRPRPAAGGAAAAPLPLLDPKTNAQAKSMNYVEKHADIKDEKLKVDRQGVKFVDQFCHNCMHYTEAGTIGKDKVGKCALFAQNSVKSEAWCATWGKKT